MSKADFNYNLGTPDYVTIETETYTQVFSGKQAKISHGKTEVEFINLAEHQDILLTSHEAVKSLKLRWQYQFPQECKFLADTWERG